MTLRLTPAAKSSLKSIGRYTEMKWGKTQRNNYLRELDSCFQTLVKHPRQGRARDELGVGLRSYQVNKHVVFYLSYAEETIIVDVLHQRMDPTLHLPQVSRLAGSGGGTKRPTRELCPKM